MFGEAVSTEISIFPVAEVLYVKVFEGVFSAAMAGVQMQRQIENSTNRLINLFIMSIPPDKNTPMVDMRYEKLLKYPIGRTSFRLLSEDTFIIHKKLRDSRWRN